MVRELIMLYYRSGDEFIIGSTTFTVKLESDFIQDEQGALMPVEENQIIEVEEIVEVDEDFEGDTEHEIGEGDKSKSPSGLLGGLLSKDALQDPVKRKKLIYGAVALMLVWVMMDDPDKTKVAKKKVVKKTEKSVKKDTGPKISPEELEFIDSTYNLARTLFESGKYKESIYELDKILVKYPGYKQSRALYQAARDGLKEIEAINRKEREAKAKAERDAKIKKLLVKAEGAVKDRRIKYAEQLISQIIVLDPENSDILVLKIDIDNYKKQKEREALELAAKKAERHRQEKSLGPSRASYRKKDWYVAILKLEELFDKEKNLDEDLYAEANTMLNESKENLRVIVDPLLAKARSLKEGQYLKGAYENYLQVLKHDPGHAESLNQMDNIRDILRIRSRKIYREAIISESLSLYNDAKEKFQEVQQVSPIDSEYYIRATEKLKEYLE